MMGSHPGPLSHSLPPGGAGATLRSVEIALLAEAPLVQDALACWLRGAAYSCEIIPFASAQDLAVRLNGGASFDLILIGDFLSTARGQHLISAARLICGAAATCPVIVVSAAGDAMLQRELLGCGVRGQVSTRMPAAAAAEVVRIVLAGGTYVPPDGTGAVTAAAPAGDQSGDATPEALTRHRLSPREYQVLSQLQLGHSNRQIAAELGISENTVMVHLRHLMRKLGATNRTQAVFKANRLSTDPFPPPID